MNRPRFLVDENFDNDIVRGVLRRSSNADFVRAQDTGLSEAEDPQVLEWAATERRIVLTHDAKTMTRYAYARLAAGQPMSGAIVVRRFLPIRIAIDDLVLIADCSSAEEWQSQVRYLPLR